MIAAILLLVLLASLALFVRRDMAEYAAFKQLEDTDARQRQFRKWIAESFAFFVGGTVLALALLGRLGSTVKMPAEFDELSARVARTLPIATLVSSGALVGLAIGLSASLLAGAIFSRRQVAKDAHVVIGDITPLLPRNGAESAHAAVLSLNAGLSEELFFRLLLPLLLVLTIHDAIAAFIVAAIVFGLVHLYQGWVGVIATTVIGLVLTVLYLATGSIWVVAGVHALFDLFGLVLRPALTRRLSAGQRRFPR